MKDEEIEERARYIISAAASNNQRLDEICIKSYVAGAHWMQDNHPLLTDIRDGKALAVDKGWLDRYERNVRKLQLKEDIKKACKWIDDLLDGRPFLSDGWKDELRQAMEE